MVNKIGYTFLGWTGGVVDKDGNVMRRCYHIPASPAYTDDKSSDISSFCLLENDYDAYLKADLCSNYKDIVFLRGTLGLITDEKFEQTVNIGQEDVLKIYQAVIEDMKAGNYYFGSFNPLADDHKYVNSLVLDGIIYGQVETIFDWMDDFDNEDVKNPLPMEMATDSVLYTGVEGVDPEYRGKISNKSLCVNLNDTMVNTINALIETGAITSTDQLTTISQCYEDHK